jgi:hypothetical protein
MIIEDRSFISVRITEEYEATRGDGLGAREGGAWFVLKYDSKGCSGFGPGVKRDSRTDIVRTFSSLSVDV